MEYVSKEVMGTVCFLIILIKISVIQMTYTFLLMACMQQCIHGKRGKELRKKGVEEESDIGLNILRSS